MPPCGRPRRPRACVGSSRLRSRHRARPAAGHHACPGIPCSGPERDSRLARSRSRPGCPPRASARRSGHPVLAHRPELGDLAPERAGNRREQLRRGLVEALGPLIARATPYWASSLAESRSRCLQSRAISTASVPPMRRRRWPRVTVAAERVGVRGQRHRRDHREHRYQHGLSHGRGGGRDERADEQELDEQGGGVDGQVDDHDERHRR